jgi:hypothetical protein
MKVFHLMKRLAKNYLKVLAEDCQPVIRQMTFEATFFVFVLLAAGDVAALLALGAEGATTFCRSLKCQSPKCRN